MEQHLLRDEMLVKMASVLSWFSRGVVVMWLTGSEGRLGWVEYWLPRLVREGRLQTRIFGKEILYARRRQTNLNLAHELACSDILTRFYISDRSGEILTLRYFKKQAGLGIVPDGGLVYSPWVLLWEYSTKNNCERLQVLRWKVGRYIRLAQARPNYQVVLVLDVTAEQVSQIITKLTPHEAIFYVDYQTFRSVPLGQQLIAPIYVNGSNGQTYPLRSI